MLLVLVQVTPTPISTRTDPIHVSTTPTTNYRLTEEILGSLLAEREDEIATLLQECERAAMD